MGENEKMHKMLEFYNNKKGERNDEDKITEVTMLDSFKLDRKVDIDMGNVYFVTREKKFDNSNDSFMYYEIYSVKNPEQPIAKTNEKFEIEILDEKLNNEFLKYKLDLEKDKKVVREMIREDKEGRLIPVCAVMDKFEQDEQNGKEKGLKRADKVKNEAVYNEKTDSLRDKEKEALSEQEIKEKTEMQGKKIQSMSRIEDPMFYQLVPDATVLTYFVTYDDGSVGIVNSHGVDITGFDEQGIRNGSLTLRKTDRNLAQTDSVDATSLDMAIYIEGSSTTHGIIFPIVNRKGNYTMEMKDIYDEDQQTMPLSMQDNANTKDNRKFLDLDEKIVKILEENGIEDPSDKDVEVLARSFYDKGDSDPDEISVLKEYGRQVDGRNVDEEELEEEIDGRGERKPRGM